MSDGVCDTINADMEQFKLIIRQTRFSSGLITPPPIPSTGDAMDMGRLRY